MELNQQYSILLHFNYEHNCFINGDKNTFFLKNGQKDKILNVSMREISRLQSNAALIDNRIKSDREIK